MSNRKYYLKYSRRFFAFLRKHGIQSIKLPERFTYVRELVELLNDEQSYTQEVQNQLSDFIEFLYGLYTCWNRMSQNAQPIWELNNYPKKALITYLLDDVPGMIVGAGDFQNCKFPFYPGYQRGQIVTDDDLRSLIY